MKCKDCYFAKWNFIWFTCPISKKTYEDGSKEIPTSCPYQNLTLKEINKIMFLTNKK